MISKIRILPEQLCNKIAAGEVVERPASVLKELLENSLDAGAADIRIEIEKGGKGLIRVVDDGEGMGRDDLFLCLERHATSKIRTDDDLFSLRTLGFRGEALPSIASVSRLTVRSCTADAIEGWEIYAEGGTVRRAGAVGMPRGTRVEVRDLFFNTPARRKFLRKEETELGHAADIVTRLALARPGVQFRLCHEGRSLLEVPRQGDLRERVGTLLGRPLAKDLLSVDEGKGDLALKGLIARPEASRSSTSAMYTFINGRYIRDRVVQHAVLDGYRQLLEKGRFPVTVLFLEIDPAMVDVNVHPTKHEVRFREQGMVHDFIAAAVREVLRPAGWIESPRPERIVPVIPLGASLPAAPADPGTGADHRGRVQEVLQSYALNHSRPVDSLPLRPISTPVASGGASSEGPFTLPSSQPVEEGFFSSLRVIGQYRSSFILAQDGDDLLLIDQHAAHERIGFERLKEQLRSGRVERQALLFPLVLDLDFRTSASLRGHLEELDRLGFELDPFGGNAFALKTVPNLLIDADPERLLRDTAEELSSVGRSVLAEEYIDRILIRMACHGMIRANRPLTVAEMAALLRDLDGVGFRGNCPHGRPVMKRLPLAEVERMFRRS